MADTSADDAEVEQKSSKIPLILGLVAALAGGGGGFYAAFSGMLFGPESPEKVVEKEAPQGALPDVAYVAMDPIIVSIGPSSNKRHLQFRAQLEVPSKYEEDVTTLLPRVIDVLNEYLRAVEPRDIEEPSALTRLRAQMLRRVRVVAGSERVNDVLVMEFVIN